MVARAKAAALPPSPLSLDAGVRHDATVNTPRRLSLAHLPTPIQKLPRLSAELGVDLYVWRDDLTGFVESGNKVRKLEFLLAEAVAQGATRIITAGAVQSNHT